MIIPNIRRIFSLQNLTQSKICGILFMRDLNNSASSTHGDDIFFIIFFIIFIIVIICTNSEYIIYSYSWIFFQTTDPLYSGQVTQIFLSCASCISLLNSVAGGGWLVADMESSMRRVTNESA